MEASHERTKAGMVTEAAAGGVGGGGGGGSRFRQATEVMRHATIAAKNTRCQKNQSALPAPATCVRCFSFPFTPRASRRKKAVSRPITTRHPAVRRRSSFRSEETDGFFRASTVRDPENAPRSSIDSRCVTRPIGRFLLTAPAARRAQNRPRHPNRRDWLSRHELAI